MFEIPSKKNVKAVRVTKDSVLNNKPLEITNLSDKEIEERDGKKAITIVPQKEKRAS
jgi:ATP-dependent protease Clp ATPase subunit